MSAWDWYIANVLAHSERQHYGEALALIRRRGVESSPAAYEYEKQFHRAIDNLDASNKKDG